MSYLPRYSAHQAEQALGASTVETIVSTSQDPYLSELICRAGQLSSIENGQAVPPCAQTPAGRVGGIGLRKVMPALRAYVYAEQNKWVYPVAIAGAIGVPFLLGWMFGRKS